MREVTFGGHFVVDVKSVSLKQTRGRQFLSPQRRRRFELGCSLGERRSNRNQQQNQNAAPKGAGLELLRFMYRNNLLIALTTILILPSIPRSPADADNLPISSACSKG